MVGRVLNRRELRKQSDEAGQSAASASAGTAAKVLPVNKVKKKAVAAAKVRKPRAKKLPARVRARWGVFDATMKQVAIFDYAQRAAADDKLADLLAKKKGLHFLQIVKEAMPEPVPAEGPGKE